MKVMITMNMPNSSGMPLHKMIAEVKGVNTIAELFSRVVQNDFLLVNQYYVTRPRDGDSIWDDLGPVIINTFHIAKIQEYVEKEAFDEDSRGYSPRGNPRPMYRR